jgi:hypothetical protein
MRITKEKFDNITLYIDNPTAIGCQQLGFGVLAAIEIKKRPSAV